MSIREDVLRTLVPVVTVVAVGAWVRAGVAPQRAEVAHAPVCPPAPRLTSSDSAALAKVGEDVARMRHILEGGAGARGREAPAARPTASQAVALERARAVIDTAITSHRFTQKDALDLGQLAAQLAMEQRDDYEALRRKVFVAINRGEVIPETDENGRPALP